jgi:hypothetical protein
VTALEATDAAREAANTSAAAAVIGALTEAMAAIPAQTLADIKTKLRALAGETPITVEFIEALSSAEQSLVASIMRDVLALS